jgi:hypothetical protein
MKLEDALRKIRLLRAVKPENGASEAEVENAANLAQALMDRFSVRPEDARPSRPQIFQMSWVYWEHLLDEYGLALNRFGKRGTAQLTTDKLLHMRLDTGEWRVQRAARGVWETIAHDRGVETLRDYLSRNAPRMYSLSRGGQGAARPR